MFEYVQAFRLLCMHEGWDWTQAVFLNELLNQTMEEITETCSETEESDRRTSSQKLMAFVIFVKASILSQLCPKKDESKAIDAVKTCECIINKLMFQDVTLNNKGLLNSHKNSKILEIKLINS